MPTHTSLVVLVSQPALASSPGCLPPAFFTCFSHCKWWKLGCLCHFHSLMQLQKRKPGHIWYRHTGSSARKRDLRLFLATFAGGRSQHQYQWWINTKNELLQLESTPCISLPSDITAYDKISQAFSVCISCISCISCKTEGDKGLGTRLLVSFSFYCQLRSNLWS